MRSLIGGSGGCCCAWDECKKYGPECITHSGPSPCISNKSNKHHRNRLVYLVYVFMEIPEMLSSGYSQP